MSGVGNVANQVMSGMANAAIGMNVLKKSLDQDENQMNQLLQSVAAPQPNPNVGSNFDGRA